MLDRGLRLLRAAARGGRGRAAGPGAVPALHGAADGRQRAARRCTAEGQRGARGRGRARAHVRRPAACALRLRPRHRAGSCPHDDPRVQHRDHRGQPACVPLRRDRARAAVRRRAGGCSPASAGVRPRRSGWLVREPSGRRVFSSQTGRARFDPQRHPVAADAGADGGRERACTRGRARRSRGRSATCAPAARTPPARFPRSSPRTASRPESIETRWQLTTAAGASAAQRRRCSCPAGWSGAGRRRRAARRLARERGVRAGWRSRALSTSR